MWGLGLGLIYQQWRKYDEALEMQNTLLKPKL
jgi:hypothetical protein